MVIFQVNSATESPPACHSQWFVPTRGHQRVFVSHMGNGNESRTKIRSRISSWFNLAMDCIIHLSRHLHGNNGPLRRTSYSLEAFWNFGCPDIFCPKKMIVLHLMLLGRFEFFVAIHHRKFSRIYGTCPMAVLIGTFLGPKMKCMSWFFLRCWPILLRNWHVWFTVPKQKKEKMLKSNSPTSNILDISFL